MTDPSLDWPILLIGGSSSTGKSTLAASLAHRFDAHCLDADLFFLFSRQVMPAEAAPVGLHEQDEAFWSQPPEVLIQNYLALDAFICRGLEPVVARHFQLNRRLVLEGTWLLPSFVVQGSYVGYDSAGPLKGLFLYEPDHSELEARRLARADPWARRFSDEVMLNIGTMRHRYGQEIKRQAEALDLPVLESRPFETLEERAFAALEDVRPR